jgi:precorrin-2 dehydrogenase/sirohydrochlorin ferrochelatase
MSRYFPLFVNLEGKKILVYGAGVIGFRRILALLEFGCELTVIAPRALPEVEKLAKEGRILFRRTVYHPGEIKEDVCLVLVAVSDKEVNAQIAAECRGKRIPVNVSSDKSLCDFYFPGLAVKDELVAGVTAGGMDHKRARAASEAIRGVVERL